MNSNIDKIQYAKDMEFGSNNENIVKEQIEVFLGTTLHKYKDKFATFDYYNNDLKILCEVKSRRNDDTKYETQLIGANKIRKAIIKQKEGYNVFFFWKLTNGLFVWKFNPNVELKSVVLGNYARNDKPADLFLVENTLLKPVKDLVKPLKYKNTNSSGIVLRFD